MLQVIAGAVVVIYIVSLAALLMLFRVAGRTKQTPARQPLTFDAQLAFQTAQREAQEAYEDPSRGPNSHEFFFLVMRALDRWEEWQGRRLSTLNGAGVDPTEAEFHAISLINSLPAGETPQYVN